MTTQQKLATRSPPTSQTPSPPPSNALALAAAKRLWTTEDLREYLALAIKDPASMLREIDRRGLGPIQFAAMQRAISIEALLPLLGLLEPQEGEGGKIEVLLKAVEAVLDGQAAAKADRAEIKKSQAEIKAGQAAAKADLAEIKKSQAEIKSSLADFARRLVA